jgi:CubicO group peptidase (beta-lactamase class C family)
MLALVLASALSLLPPVTIEGEPGYALRDRMRHYAADAVTVAVWRDGKVVSVRGYGVPPDALFQAGSISKTLTAVAVLRTLERESVPLDTDVNALLRTWKLDEGPYAGKITIERILSHTAGLNVPGFPGYEPGDPRPASLREELQGGRFALTQPLRVETEPGKRPRYSGGGYALLQQMLVDVHRRPFADVMQREVLGPAGMHASTFAQPLPRALLARATAGLTEDRERIPRGGWIYPEQAAAGLWTTARDLARFVIALQTDRLLPHETTQRMLAAAPATNNRLGLGVFLLRNGNYFAHAGGNAGYYALFVASRTRADGVAILTNSELASDLADEIARGVAKKYGWEGYLPEPRKRVDVDPAPFAGRYRIDADDVLTVRVTGRDLIASHTLGEEFSLIPIGPNEFTRRDADEQYKFDGSLVRIQDGSLTPAELLEADRVEEGMAAYRKLDPSLLDEERLRARGVALRKRGKTAAAVALLAFNAELHPRSAAAWDALASAQVTDDNVAGAKISSRKVLEVLQDDETATASWRVVYRKRAERRLRE